ncbi:cytochrome b [Pseudoalteromonas sp. MMG013]|uniref:cytochrome b n=1 Tax=Pseudoalteromonas sp. MMG013 TaxID=2822687 RepID=UPI001B396531|nr:cytochrome b [Pseudoalteromonas sp. MMG013]MBQ4862765.1 cytochrome b [Pseudoalteromonas sp. MMG013]
MIRNSRNSYGWIAIVFHWLSAFVILGMFALGLYMVDLSYYDPWYRDALTLHKSIGVLVAVLIILRLIWKYCNAQVGEIESHRKFAKLQSRLASFAQVAMYLFLFVLFASGYLISTADGRGIDVFNLFMLPSMGEIFDQQSDIAGLVHLYVAWTLISVVSIHALAALYHHFILKDLTLKRMCIPQTEK